jgi:acetoin utilization deacetylase AcuC-like enzyme
MAEHAPPDGHPERPARLAAALRGVRGAGVELAEREAQPAPREALLRVHSEDYLDALDEACEVGGWIDADTYAHLPSREAYRRSAGGAIAAVEDVLAGELDGAISLGRPPGHHATPVRPMGFCLVSNVACAVRAGQAKGARRVAVVDWDVHHGNGTQEVFWRDADVLVVSLQQWPLWPLSGGEDERGEGPGAGTTLNLCFAAGAEPEAYLARFEGEALPAVEAFEPELVVVSCGFDSHERDPLADLRLRDETYGRLMAGVVEVARRTSAPPPVVVLEGGYDLQALEHGCAEVTRALGQAEIRRA